MSGGLERPAMPVGNAVVRDGNVRLSQYYGPAPRSACPCGSGRPARRCHRAVDHSWISTRPPALLTDERTGYANPGCYARVSGDCDHDLTREHFISDDLLEAISADGKVVVVEGAAWQEKSIREKTIGRNSLSSRMLCYRHNNALWPLDEMASTFFRHFRDDLLDVMTFHGSDFSRGFTLVSGPYLELWMLKAAWGAIEARAMDLDGAPAYRFRLGVTTEQLAEILWRGADWPRDWGMYVLLNQHSDLPVKQNSIQIRPAAIGSEILGVYIQIAGVEFLISFELPPVARIHRPSGLTFTRVGFPVTSWKMAAFAWPDLGHPIINVVSQVPPKVNFLIPPNARAAALAHTTLPGSLKISSGARSPEPS